MIIIRAAVGFTDNSVTMVGKVLLSVAAFVMMCAMVAAFMRRMNLFACEAFDKCGNELMIGRMTGMHVKTYDTQAVPYCKQTC